MPRNKFSLRRNLRIKLSDKLDKKIYRSIDALHVYEHHPGYWYEHERIVFY